MKNIYNNIILDFFIYILIMMFMNKFVFSTTPLGLLFGSLSIIFFNALECL